jgi:hypothetical protein
MQRVEIAQDFALPVDRVFAFLSEHENLGPLLGADIRRLQDGDTSRNGVGSVRRLKIGPLPAFEETVTQVEPDALVEYRITKGSPLTDHRGELRFAPRGSGSTVTWRIEFGAPPVLDRIVALGLRRTIAKGLRTVDAKA